VLNWQHSATRYSQTSHAVKLNACSKDTTWYGGD